MPWWFIILLFLPITCQAQSPSDEIIPGGPEKDGIPALTAPKLETVTEADRWMTPRQPVILLRIEESTRAYPLRIIIWHEIVNDTLGGRSVLVTYCPLCNTAIAFDRVFGGDTLGFGTTGKLRRSNMIMYDRATESWWQQATGEGIVGAHAGARLTPIPAAIISWEKYRAAYPNGTVLSRETGYDRDYDRLPYGGYDDIGGSPFLYRGKPIPTSLPAMARVLGVAGAVAYPYEVIEREKVIDDTAGGRPVAIFWEPGTSSPFDERNLVGSALAFSRIVGGRTLTFRLDHGAIVDEETGSRWSVLGVATYGRLAGTRLEPAEAVNHFWFSWSAFNPEGRLYR